MSDRESYTRKGDLVAQPQTLAGFLLARIAEDEERIYDDARPPSLRHIVWMRSQTVADRVLAECEAKRRIVDVLRWDTHRSRPIDAQKVAGYVLNALALPYADHPDYREEWKP